MKNQVVCEFCGKVFSKDLSVIDLKKECFRHEVLEHLNGEETLKNYIEKAISELNKEYSIEGAYSNYVFNPYYTDGMYEEDRVEVTFDLRIKDCCYNVSVEFICKDMKMYVDKNDIKQEISRYYRKEKKEFTGIVKEDAWCGGYGSGDYLLDGVNLGDLLGDLVGKKISIKIIE